jgi:hypothetical protein
VLLPKPRFMLVNSTAQKSGEPAASEVGALIYCSNVYDMRFLVVKLLRNMYGRVKLTSGGRAICQVNSVNIKDWSHGPCIHYTVRLVADSSQRFYRFFRSANISRARSIWSPIGEIFQRYELHGLSKDAWITSYLFH